MLLYLVFKMCGHIFFREGKMEASLLVAWLG